MYCIFFWTIPDHDTFPPDLRSEEVVMYRKVLYFIANANILSSKLINSVEQLNHGNITYRYESR